jgi:8-oxo-dGTP diphosphatase
MPIKIFFLNIAAKLVYLYWKLANPKTNGVAALICHPQDTAQCLLVQQTYGDTNAFNLPGGGYSPSKETPQRAILREIKEELNLACDDAPILLGEYYTEAQGNRNSVHVFLCKPTTIDITANSEIKAFHWIPMSDLQKNQTTYGIVIFAIERFMNISN